MSTNHWIGGAGTAPDTFFIVPANVSIGNIFTLTRNGKSVSYQTSLGTVADVVAGLLAVLTASTAPVELGTELLYTNSTTYLLGVAKTPGIPIPTITASASKGTGPSNVTPTLTISQSLATPVNGTFTTASTGGALSNGTYFYRVSAVNAQGETTSSTESPLAISGGTSTQTVTVTWTRVPGAVGYKIYGRATGAELYIAGVLGEATLSYVDTGSITPAGALPGANTTALTSKGPNDWSTPGNWSTGSVPVAADDVVLTGSYDILFGLNQSSITLNSLTADPTFGPGNSGGSGTVGLPEVNAAGYTEDRPLKLKIGVSNGVTVNCTSGRLKFDANSVNTTINVLGTGSPLDPGLKSFLLNNTATGSTLNITKGSVAVAHFAGETASLTGGLNVAFKDNVAGDADVEIGAGVTLAGVNQTGGKIDCYATATITTWTELNGESWHRAGAIATLALEGGTLHENAPGTCLTTAVSVYAGAFLDFSQDLRAKTITPKVNYYAGCKMSDPLGKVTYSATPGWTVPDGSLEDATLDFGVGRNYTVA